MRKVVVFLCLLALLLTSCANAATQPKEETVEEPVSKEIELTEKNYQDYLETNFQVRKTGTRKGECSVTVTGNPHYKYNSVELKIRVFGYGLSYMHAAPKVQAYRQWLLNSLSGDPGEMPEPDFDTTETIRLNLAGNANATIPLIGYLDSEYVYITFVSISGTVEEY